MSSKKKAEKSPKMTKNAYYSLLSTHSIQALDCHKKHHHSAYEDEILSLSQACAALVILHAESPQSLILFMETAMIKEHHNALNKIDSDIQHLFNIRKRVSPHTMHGERDIAKISIEISQLQKEKEMEIKPIIREIVRDSLIQACKNNNIDIPEDFDPRSYRF